ncbi:MAG: branched-chain amino acid ABC transporter permease [Proteobacteria bacterium]|nr:branched-chain amino acid ABC transporter permease [Pseudomonadota bacterium]
MTAREEFKFFIAMHRTGIAVLTLTLFLALFPLFEDNPYVLGITNQIAINLIIVVGLNLFIGYAGQMSLGHAAFFGLGAYGSAVLTTYLGIWPWISICLVAGLVALSALIVGIPSLRLSGHYLTMATLGFNIVVYIIMNQWDEITGGPSGFPESIPSLALGDFAFDDDVKFHYLVWAVAMLTLILGLNLVRSAVGRGLAALASNEVAAGALGVDTKKAKVKIFVLSTVYASVAGSLYAHYFGFVNPDTFGIFVSVDLVIMVVIGGMGSIWGSLFGAGIITILPEFLDIFETYKDVIHGLILVLVLLFLPQGLVTGLVETIKTKIVLRRQRNATATQP